MKSSAIVSLSPGFNIFPSHALVYKETPARSLSRPVSDVFPICRLGSVSLSLAISYTLLIFSASGILYEYCPKYHASICAIITIFNFLAIYSSQFTNSFFVHNHECETSHNRHIYDAEHAKKVRRRTDPTADFMYFFLLRNSEVRICKFNSFRVKALFYREIERKF